MQKVTHTISILYPDNGCLSVRHGSDALPICGPISGCIVSATVTLPYCEPVMLPHYILQVASARFARFSYCGRGFARSARFTLYGNPMCTIEVVKLNT